MRRALLVASAVAGAFLAGCATQRDRGTDTVNERLRASGAPAANFHASAPPAAVPAEAIGVQRAVELAFERSATVRELYAELGVGTADVIEARTPPALTLGYAGLKDGDASKITRSAALSFADILLMPARVRFAGAELASTRDRVTARLQALEHDVRAAWYESVAASHGAEMAALGARTARASAEYAKRLDAAGNLPPRTLALELASAAEADIAAARAAADSLRARARFASLVGLSTREPWRLDPHLAVPPAADATPPDLIERALAQRPDIAAARREADAFESALGTARAWRWLGDFELGYERETEAGGARLRGPTFSLKLPLFGFNRAGVLRAEAARDAALARRDSLELAVRNDVALALDRMATARVIADTYRSALLPQREAATARTLESTAFMLSGAFELLATRREQFAAYRETIDAVRDYWLARVDLEQALGAHLAEAPNTPPLDFKVRGESR